jgi:hypothetical protein
MRIDMALWLTMIRDTVVVRQLPVPQTTFQVVTGVASGIVSIILCVIALSIIPAALYLRSQIQRASEALVKAQASAEPALKEASALLVDLRAIATTARADAMTIHNAVAEVDAGIRSIRTRVESRFAEIDAVIQVVQHEVEDVFVSTAAAARGVRAGAASLVHRQGVVGNGATPDEATDLSVEGSTYDDNARDARPGRARPRIRSRRDA